MPKSSGQIFNILFPNLSGTQFLDTRWPDQACWCNGSINRLPESLRAPELCSIQALGLKYHGRISFGNAKSSSRTVAVENIGLEMLLGMGLSLYLPDIEQTLPNLSEVLRQVELAVGAPPGSARVGVFIAPKENGVTCHYDGEEVFSIQLIGNKRFYIAKAAEVEQPVGPQYNQGAVPFDDMYPQVGERFPDPDTAKFTTVDLKPGSVLFMPRGTWHRSEAGETSLSISIIIRPPSAMESVLKVMYLRMLQDPAWRRPLHGAWGEPKQEQVAQNDLKKLMVDFSDLGKDLNLDDIRPMYLSEPDRLSLINSESWFHTVPSAKLLISHSHDKTSARVRSKDADSCERETLKLEVPPLVVEIFNWLANKKNAFHAAEMAAEFSSLPMEQHLQILSTMVQSGYLKQLWFQPRNTARSENH